MLQKTVILFISIMIAACASTDAPVTQSDPYSGTKRQIASIWNGKPVDDLVARYGQPDMVINTTLLGRPESEGYVYNMDRRAGNDRCLNVYVVTTYNRKIMDYFCR